MRETFESVDQLLGYYSYLKSSVRGIKTLLPKKHQGSWTMFSALAVKHSQEEKFCFIGDVEKYAQAYYKHKLSTRQRRNIRTVPIPYDCVLFIMEQYYSTDSSLQDIARCFRWRIERGELLPARLKYRQHISQVLSDMKKYMEAYFHMKGYIVPAAPHRQSPR